MFVGHFAVALAGKRVAPKMSLGTLIFGAQFLDLIWPPLVLLGLERFHIDVAATKATPLAFDAYPISHSLLMAIVWAVLIGGVYGARKRYRIGALMLGVAVFSHWFLDWITHRPDLQLAPGISTRVGLGLWNHPALEVTIETAMYVAAVAIYAVQTRARDRRGTWGFVLFLAFLSLIWLGDVAGPPPTPGPDMVRTIAWTGLALWFLVPWAAWFDRHRRLRQGPPSFPSGGKRTPAGILGAVLALVLGSAASGFAGSGPDRDLLARHIERLRQARAIEVLIPRSLRLDMTARRPQLLGTVSMPPPGWRESLIALLELPGAFARGTDSLTLYDDAQLWEVRSENRVDSTRLVLDLEPDLISMRSRGLQPIAAGCAPIADRLRVLVRGLSKSTWGGRVLESPEPSRFRAPQRLRMDAGSRALQAKGAAADTIWYRADLSNRGTVESVFPRTPGLVDETERRALEWTFFPAFLDGRPITARVDLGVLVPHDQPPPRGIDPATWAIATARSGGLPALLQTDSLLLGNLRSGGAPWDTVQVRVFVGIDGLVRSVQVVRGVPGTDAEINRVVRRSRYRPSVFHGSPVGAWTDFKILVSSSRRRTWKPPPQQSGADTFRAPPNGDPEHGEFVYYEDPPVKLEGPAPVYPEAARNAGIRGTVVVHLLIGRDGRVRKVKVVRSVDGLDAAATEAVSRWVYKPALSNNKPVAVWIEASVPFPPSE